ncbi:MAG: YtxH domain-containing protein [Runella slithyformis]|jgi:gas vesicle protein|nr:MAG: YtxH domain-containing protein [Runella sp.]TAG20968.1 MAG: YtxH domain-containing protein [Cytophagales bacterium]TAG40125.1 MAG: YtxH domain-containing protein [Cytophagia bacterium]TAG53230.1 MAG: YtxH domain-containing protein [Runella slithyformis]TAG72357.1 MAG: YtxH domain-containing protein [Runella slithyformis]
MNSSSKVLVGFLAGVATGTAIGILYAPEKGEITRDKLSYQLSKYRDQLQKLVNDLVDGQNLPESLAKTEGQKVVNDAREKAEKLLEDVDRLMSQIKGEPA